MKAWGNPLAQAKPEQIQNENERQSSNGYDTALIK
jgi:hypothetical protein